MPKFIGEIIQNGGDFALLDSSNLRGGFTQIKTIEDRDSIPADKLKINTLVYVEDTDSIFRYTEDGWSVFTVNDTSIKGARFLSPSTLIIDTKQDDSGELEYILKESIFEPGDIIGLANQNSPTGDYFEVIEVHDSAIKIVDSTGGNNATQQLTVSSEFFLAGNTTDNARALFLMLHKINGAIVLSQFINKNLDNVNSYYNLRLGQDINNRWKVYADNVHLKGDFFDKRGRNISELASTEYESLRREFGYDNLINNPSFITGFECWEAEQEATYYKVANKIVLTDKVLLTSTYGAQVCTEDGQTFLKLEDCTIKQTNDNFREVVDFSAGDKTWFDIFYTYQTITPGTLTIKLGGTIKDFFNFTSTDYKVHRASFKWDGAGDLEIVCSGIIKLKSLVIRPNEVKTLIETYNLELK